MIKIDPHDRIDLTGSWAGFGFQGGHMFAPEGHQLDPCDMAWWSLTCNIAREWRLRERCCEHEISSPVAVQRTLVRLLDRIRVCNHGLRPLQSLYLIGL